MSFIIAVFLKIRFSKA